MEKDRVIELAGNNKIDEREENIFLKGFQVRNIGVLFILLVLYTLRLLKGNHDNSDLFLILVTSMTFTSLHYLKEYRNKLFLVASLLGIVAMIFGFIIVLTEYAFI